MTSEILEEKKIPPVKNNTVYLSIMLGVLFGGVLCLLYAGWYMSISAVLKNL
jgi:hypothetical protein